MENNAENHQQARPPTPAIDLLKKLRYLYQRYGNARGLQVVILLLIFTSVPATVFLAQQRQDNRQRACGGDNDCASEQEVIDQGNRLHDKSETNGTSGANGTSGDTFIERLDGEKTGSTNTGTQSNSVTDLSNPGQGVAVDQFNLSREQAAADVEAARQFYKDTVNNPNTTAAERAIAEKNLGIAISNEQRANATNNPKGSNNADVPSAVTDFKNNPQANGKDLTEASLTLKVPTNSFLKRLDDGSALFISATNTAPQE